MVFPSWGAFLNISTIIDYSGSKISPYILIAWSPRVLLGKSMWTLSIFGVLICIEFSDVLRDLQEARVKRDKTLFPKTRNKKPQNQKNPHFMWEEYLAIWLSSKAEVSEFRGDMLISSDMAFPPQIHLLHHQGPFLTLQWLWPYGEWAVAQWREPGGLNSAVWGSLL